MVKYNLLPCIPWLKNQALKRRKKGFINSDGCMLIPNIFIHLFDPLISKSRNNIINNNIVNINNPNNENLLNNFMSNEEIIIINMIEDREYTRCLL